MTMFMYSNVQSFDCLHLFPTIDFNKSILFFVYKDPYGIEGFCYFMSMQILNL